MTLPLSNRRTAGRELASALKQYAGRRELLVLALPRGGVPVALEIAKGLYAPLDLMLVRKLGVPGHRELAMGAIAGDGVRVLNQNIIDSLHIGLEAIEETAAREEMELQRRNKAYRGSHPQPAIRNRLVVLVDDGIATGATMRAAIEALRMRNPARIVVAVPVGPADAIERLRELADEVVCPYQPEPFMAIGHWYLDFSQLEDEEVREMLAEAWQESASGA